jgi:dethiobiotin synthetase
MATGIFVTATDTGAGKTHFCCLLVRKLREAGVDAVGLKPFCCGDRGDAERLYEACGGTVEIGLINPVWLQVPPRHTLRQWLKTGLWMSPRLKMHSRR